MSPNRRILLNIVTTYGRSLYALVSGVFCGRWTLAVMVESDFGLDGGVGVMTLMTLLACTMGLIRGGSACFRLWGLTSRLPRNDTRFGAAMAEKRLETGEVRYSVVYPQ